MRTRFCSLMLLGVFFLAFSRQEALGQSMARLNQSPWNGTDIQSGYDNPFIESSGHVSGSNDGVRVYQWDSFGRVRFNKNSQDSPFVAYRILTSSLYTQSPIVHSTMDEFDLAVGVHWGQIADWKISTMTGIGYSSTHPFVNEKGLFGIGNITAEHALGEHNSILLAIDYAGNGGLLPDVPLPGFAWMHHDDHFEWMLGFPIDRFKWQPIPPLTITAEYAVPYSGNVNIEYLPWQHFGFYANASNYFQGIVIQKENSINRQFFQVRRVEAGVRIIVTPLVDAGVGIGYAFDQTISQGYDVRSMRGIAHLSNEPYISVVLHGRL